jgi:hypothetical protein
VIEFVADGLRDELAAVLLSPVNVSDEVVGQGDRDTFDAGHFHTPGMIIPPAVLRRNLNGNHQPVRFARAKAEGAKLTHISTR